MEITKNSLKQKFIYRKTPPPTIKNYQNVLAIKIYLNYYFKYKKMRKNKFLYMNICKIYNHFPSIIISLIKYIKYLGYNKDLYLILFNSKNSKLSSYLRDFIFKRIKHDLKLMEKNKKISTIGKYLPRFDSEMCKKIDLIKHFCIYFNFESKNLFEKIKYYRQTKSKFTKYLSVIEYHLCTKDYKNISWNNMSPFSIKKNMKSIVKTPELKQSYEKHVYNKLKFLPMQKLIKMIINNKYDPVIIDYIWQKNKNKYFKQMLKELNLVNNKNLNLIIDLSQNTYQLGKECDVIKYALFFDELAYNKNIQLQNGKIINLLKFNIITDKVIFLSQQCFGLEMDQIKYDQYSVIITSENNFKNPYFKLILLNSINNIKNKINTDNKTINNNNDNIKQNLNETNKLNTNKKYKNHKIMNNRLKKNYNDGNNNDKDLDIITINSLIRNDKNLEIGINPKYILLIMSSIYLLLVIPVLFITI